MASPSRTLKRSQALTLIERSDQAKELHAKLCGELIWEWNELHRVYGFVFTTLLGESNLAMAPALWTALVSDTAQRDLLKTAVEWADGLREGDRQRLTWAIEQTGKIAPYRNDIVHGAGGLLLTERGVVTKFSASGNPLKRLMRHHKADTPLPELMVAIRDDLKRLSEFVTNVWRRLGSQKPEKASPRKPTLRYALLVQAGQARTHVQPRRQTSKPRQ